MLVQLALLLHYSPYKFERVIRFKPIVEQKQSIYIRRDERAKLRIVTCCQR